MTMKKKKNKGLQDKVINYISGMVLTLAVIIVIMNIAGGDNKSMAGQPITVAGSDYIAANNDEGLTTDGSNDNTNNTDEGSSEDNSGDVDESTEPVTSQEPTSQIFQVSSKEYQNVALGRLEETKYVDSEYFENTIFLGDSRTVALSSHKFISARNTFAINGINHITFLTQQFTDMVTGVTGDIFQIVRERKPERIYVALGVNGVAFIDEGIFLSKYQELISGLMEASPESIIIIQSILPVNEVNYTGANKKLNNENIDRFNRQLLAMAEKNGIYYLDIATRMKDANNQLISQYDGGDGIHYSFTGYSIVYDAICKHGVEK